MSGNEHNPLRRPPWREFRAALDAAGFHPSRRLGQNFLLDENLLAAIVADAGVKRGDFVLEVGPGCGFLSVHLAAEGVRLLAVEVDRRLAEVAAPFLEPYPGAELIRTDILAGKHELAPEVTLRLPQDEPWHLVSNLPYSIASPLLVVLSRSPNPPLSMTALVQTEVAERVAAGSNQAGYGPLGIRLQALYETRLGRRVAPSSFWPRPRVESAVVHLARRAELPTAAVLEPFDRLVEALFRSRRKGLRALCAVALGSGAAADAWLAEEGLDPRARPENLSPARLLELAASATWVQACNKAAKGGSSGGESKSSK